jgi:hypothetical protein
LESPQERPLNRFVNLSLIWLCSKFVVVFVLRLSRSLDFFNCSIWQTFWQLSIYGQAKPVTVTLLDIVKSEFIIKEWNKGRKAGGEGRGRVVLPPRAAKCIF